MSEKKFLRVVIYRKATPVKSAAQKTKETIRKPAKWVLYFSLPVAILGFAATLAIQNIALQKKTGIVAAVAIAASVLSAAWLIATTYMAIAVLICVPLLAITGWVMVSNKDRGFLFKKK